MIGMDERQALAIKEMVDSWPLLTEGQKSQLSMLLQPQLTMPAGEQRTSSQRNLASEENA